MMNALPKTGDLFATDQVSPDTERCCRYQLRNFAQWMETEQGMIELEDVRDVGVYGYAGAVTAARGDGGVLIRCPTCGR